MPSFDLPVREAGRVLGEARVAVPELSFLPEAAAHVVERDGRGTPLLGWGGRLWEGMREPRSGAPLSLDAFVALSAAGPRPNPFEDPGAAAFENPFEPDRVRRPLGLSPRAPGASVLAARTAEILEAARDLAVIAGQVHRAVPYPVHRLVPSRAGYAVDVRFEDPRGDPPPCGWDVFRADRGDAAEDFARMAAKAGGGTYLGRVRDVRVVYGPRLPRDDVHAAFADATGRFARLAARMGGALPGGGALAREARSTVLGVDRFGSFEEAEAADALAGRMGGLLRGTVGAGMARDATLRVLDLVALRYEWLDRPALQAPASRFPG